MAASDESIKYKSIVVVLLGVLISMVGFVGGSAISKLDRLEKVVISLETMRSSDEKITRDLSRQVEQLTERVNMIDRQLSPQIDFLTQWLVDTFGQPKPKGKVQFGR